MQIIPQVFKSEGDAQYVASLYPYGTTWHKISGGWIVVYPVQ